VDHKKSYDAIRTDDAYVIVNRKQHPKSTIKGWKLCIKWKDGTTSWESLAAQNESYPVRVADYAIASKLVSESAFNCWVPYTLKIRQVIVLKMKTKYQRT
jgi:hypothetical protein